MTASGDRPNKRTRKDPSSDRFAGSKKPTTTPFEASKCTLVEKLATLPTLHESQKTYLLDKHVEYIKTRKTLKNLIAREKETAVDLYKLKSTRFAFELCCSDRLYEDKKTAVDELRATCKLAVETMQEKLRKEVLKLIKLEIESVKLNIQELFLSTILLIANTLALLDPTVEDFHYCDIYQFSFDSAQHSPSLLKYSCFADANALYDMIFQQEQKVTPAPTAAANATAAIPAPIATAYRCPDPPEYNVTATTPAVPTFIVAIEALFTTSWDSFLKCERDLAQDQAVYKYIKTFETADASEATAMDIDDIQTDDNKTLEETVKRAMAIESKKIRADLEKALNQLAKNAKRGALQPSASPKKKTVSFRTPLDHSRKQKGKQAAEADNASSKGTRRKKKAQKSSNKSKQRSNTRGKR